ncbi:MAG: hypothetical protein NTY15_13015 [Planctomycetota bacterium]|nr:hypothetical protein [Planctomycetota bacterium]
MKTNLEPSRVQWWSLLGIKPMHRALLRRTVERAAIPLTEAAASRIELKWSNFEATMNQSHLECFDGSSIQIIDRNILFKRIEDHKGNEVSPEMDCQRSNAQIRLLWNWCKRGKEDLMWCTELSFDGCIYDLASMHRWVRVCLKHGRISQSQNNLILRDLQLPKILPSSSSLVYPIG